MLRASGHALEVDRIYGPATRRAVLETALAWGRMSAAGTRVTWADLMFYAKRAQAGRWAPELPDTLEPDGRLEARLRARLPRLFAEPDVPKRERLRRINAYNAAIAHLATLPAALSGATAWPAHRTPDAAALEITRHLYRENIAETWGSNRGPWIDILRELGGENPHAPTAYCARALSGVRALVELYALHAMEAGHLPHWPTARTHYTGRAWELYAKAPASHRVELSLSENGRIPATLSGRLLPGMSVTRARTSRPATDRRIIQSGAGVVGHAMLLADVAPHSLAFFAFNSSGAGHSSTARSGRLAIEVAAAKGSPGSSRAARAAWVRIAGAASLCPIA